MPVSPYVYKELPLMWEISYIIMFNFKKEDAKPFI